MKKSFLPILTLILLSIILLSFTMFYPSGSPGGYTASPMDANNCTACHGGSAVTVDNYITTNIPVEGYTPGQTYDITVAYSGSGKKGFELTAEANSAKVGTFTTASGTKLVNSNHAITHSSYNNNNDASWSFTWEAPTSGTGNITFYSAFVVGEPNTKLCSVSFNENTTVDINNLKKEYKLFPNPAINIINIETPSNTNKKIKIYSLTGKLCLETKINKNSNINISKLTKGVYTVIIYDGKKIKSMKFVKK